MKCKKCKAEDGLFGYDFCLGCMKDFICSFLKVERTGAYMTAAKILEVDKKMTALIGKENFDWTDDYDIICELQKKPLKLYCYLGALK